MESAHASIVVEGFEWDYSEDGNINHLAKHDLRRNDVEAVLSWGPVFRLSTGTGSATHIMIGRDARNRSLQVYLRATPDRNIWKPVTGWQSAAAHQVLLEEGRI